MTRSLIDSQLFIIFNISSVENLAEYRELSIFFINLDDKELPLFVNIDL